MGQLELFGGRPKVEPTVPPVPPAPARRAPPPSPPGLLATRDLRARGWTARAIHRFLVEPDVVTEWTRGTWSGVEHRYDAARVAQAEASPEFAAWVQQRDARRAAAARGLERALAEAAAWTPTIPRKSLEAIRALAVNDYNRRLCERAERNGDWSGRPAALDSEPGFLDRISVNYIRHAATEYEAKLDELDRRGDRGRALKATVKRRVLEAIAATYPELAEECARQCLTGAV